jgi:uncharacterized MAPEG superfamily protein
MFAWAPLSLAKYKSFGMKYLASNRSKTDMELSKWGGRAERAYNNLKDYSVPFVGAVLLAMIVGVQSTLFTACIWIYLISRKLHFSSYCYGIVSGRAGFWAISIVSNVIIFIEIIRTLSNR